MAKGTFGQSKFGWEFFGSELKRRREAAGLTQCELGRRVFCSGSYIGQFESAWRKPQLEIAVRIDGVLGTDDFFERMCKELIDGSVETDYFKDARLLEGLATAIQHYAPMYVPGILQTEAYTRAVVLGSFPLTPEDDLTSWTASRMERQGILDRPTRPQLWVIIDEGVLRRPIGGAVVMHEQLRRLAAMARERRVVIQVHPYSAGAPALSGMVKIMEFDDAPPVVYTEGSMTGCLHDVPDQVARYVRGFNLAAAAALSPEASLSLIETVAEEYARERGTQPVAQEQPQRRRGRRRNGRLRRSRR
ncbi:helix-turn-helix domain-containing protein [Streptomyces luteireticuli]|uniref:helix-turn-helix domain-containing protein n=1 Tax=Streptomyces luteireticuli TaxID=173858 RepID=UPI003556938D